MTAQTIVITGASRGIGAASALALAAPGVQLFLAARDKAGLERVAAGARALGADAYPIVCDVTREGDVQQLIAQVTTNSQQIDALVLAAGRAVVAPFAELTPTDWQDMLQVGVTGAFLCCKYALPHLAPHASILTIGSVAARQAFPGWAAYCVAKAGLLALTNVLREELRSQGIRVTSILPGATDTALWEAVPGEWNRRNMIHADDVARAIAWVLAQPAEVVIEELTVGHVIGRL